MARRLSGSGEAGNNENEVESGGEQNADPAQNPHRAVRTAGGRHEIGGDNPAVDWISIPQSSRLFFFTSSRGAPSGAESACQL
jgi:hypothetical protein